MEKERFTYYSSEDFTPKHIQTSGTKRAREKKRRNRTTVLSNQPYNSSGIVERKNRLQKATEMKKKKKEGKNQIVKVFM